jgi:hypothetical protein
LQSPQFRQTPQVSQGFGAPPPAGVFGTQVVPQTGIPAASQFTAFMPKTEPASRKVFGFIPPNVFAIGIIAIISVIVVGGIIVSIKNATKAKTPDNPDVSVSAESGADVVDDDPLAEFFD